MSECLTAAGHSTRRSQGPWKLEWKNDFLKVATAVTAAFSIIRGVSEKTGAVSSCCRLLLVDATNITARALVALTFAVWQSTFEA